MRKIGKGRQVKFVKKVDKYLKEKGAELSTEWFSHSTNGYKLNTKAGILHIGLEYPTNEHYCFSVFGRFKDVEKAKKILGVRDRDLDGRLNPFSGKWNFHYADEEQLFALFKMELDFISL